MFWASSFMYWSTPNIKIEAKMPSHKSESASWFSWYRIAKDLKKELAIVFSIPYIQGIGTYCPTISIAAGSMEV